MERRIRFGAPESRGSIPLGGGALIQNGAMIDNQMRLPWDNPFLDVPGRKLGSMVIGSMGYFTYL